MEIYIHELLFSSQSLFKLTLTKPTSSSCPVFLAIKRERREERREERMRDQKFISFCRSDPWVDRSISF